MATLIIEHSDHAPAGRFAEVLRDSGHRLRSIRPHRGDAIPRDLDGIDAILACGGAQSAIGSLAEWMSEEMDLLRQAHENAVPVLGICFGSQLLGRALGATVEPMEGTVECGWHEVRLTPAGREDPLFAGIGWTTQQLHWHGDGLTGPPPEGRILASSERTQVQAWAVGLRTYGIQYHPEVTRATFQIWCRDEPNVVRDAGLTLDGLQKQHDALYEDFDRLGRRLAERTAMILMPVDRRFAGIARDLHH